MTSVTLWLIWSSGQREANAPEPRAIAPRAHLNGKQLAARIAKRDGEFNGGGHLAPFRAGIGPWNWTPDGGLPAVLCHLDRRAAAAPGKDAILVLAHRGHGVRKPKAGSDQSDHKNECNNIHNHAVTVVVRILAALILCQVINGRRGRRA